MQSTGVLYLLPNLLDDELSHEPFLPVSVNEAISNLDGLIAESEKGARRYLRRFLTHDQMAKLPLRLLNEHTPVSELLEMIEPVAQGQKWGLVSDAGLPCLVDPGAPLVLLAHERNLEVKAFSGPSSFIFALQLSGLNGQRFAFHGYLPRETPALQQRLRQLEKISMQEDATQIWIEAPYRSPKMAQIVIETLQPTTLLCIALSITTPRQRIRTQEIVEWRNHPFSVDKEPAVFLLLTRGLINRRTK
jgi:16S rRNA (cytidine1402-2'-O)-methyltransferase